MIDREKAKELRKRKRFAEKLFRLQDTLNNICEEVINGGSLLQICERWEILYSSAIAWIYADEKRKEQYERALKLREEWTVQRVIDELKALALTDLREAFDADGKLKPMSSLPPAISRAIATVEVFEEWEGRGDDRKFLGLTKKVKLWDKTKALELIGKNLKMFVDQVEHKHQVSLEDLVNGSYSDKQEE